MSRVLLLVGGATRAGNGSITKITNHGGWTWVYQTLTGLSCEAERDDVRMMISAGMGIFWRFVGIWFDWQRWTAVDGVDAHATVWGSLDYWMRIRIETACVGWDV